MSKKIAEVTIKIKGSKKFKQWVVDRVYEVLMTEDVQETVRKPGCGYEFSSTLAPSGKVAL